jgi:transposase-like protein
VEKQNTLVERGGRVRVVITDHANATNTMRFVRDNVKSGSILHTDESPLYNRAKLYYDHHAVKHGAQEYVRGDDFTNSIEGFWGTLKPSLRGTHRSVSKKYLELYVCEFVWRYNRRGTCLWPQLYALAVRPSSESDQSVP